ncbi:hypothetical protein NECID01_1365 [Nematocida sp. AWRm77]|nr:hypothetical protein NECID01_1365 [Nematocida sp. AWRm77]
MKIQIESIEEFESIFKELVETEGGKTPEDMLDVLMQIKDVFLKNVEIEGKELNLGRIVQEGVNRKKTQAKLISKIEEAETQKISQLKELCSVRKELPLLLQKEISEGYAALVDTFKSAESVSASEESVLPEEPLGISATVQDLSTKLPALVSQLKERIANTEYEVKERIKTKGKQIEIEALSLLFKDELELLHDHK